MSDQALFIGTCVGGPLNGEARVHGAPVLFANMARPLDGPLPYDFEATAPIFECVYIHTPVQYPGGELGLWIPSGDTLEAAIEAILSGFTRDAQRQAAEK